VGEIETNQLSVGEFVTFTFHLWVTLNKNNHLWVNFKQSEYLWVKFKQKDHLWVNFIQKDHLWVNFKHFRPQMNVLLVFHPQNPVFV